MAKWFVVMRGERHEWIMVIGEAQAKGMMEDGIPVFEIANTVPVWAANLGLTRLWCRLEDLWNWPSRWGRR